MDGDLRSPNIGALKNPFKNPKSRWIFSKKLPEYNFQWFTFGTQSDPVLDTVAGVEEVDEDSDSTSSSSSSTSDEAHEPEHKPQKGSADPKRKEFFMTHWQYRCVVHAMIASTEPAHWLPQRDGVHLRPACGRPMKSNGQLLDCITAEHQLCQHAACRKLWAHFSLE